jgi:hypothetical protein
MRASLEVLDCDAEIARAKSGGFVPMAAIGKPLNLQRCAGLRKKRAVGSVQPTFVG